MTARFLPGLALLSGLSACMTPAAAPRAGFDRQAATAAIDSAADRMRGCYRKPRVPRPARQITTRLRVRYGADGALIGMPEVVMQDGVTMANRLYAPRMAEAAIAAVIRCSPMTLPPDLYAAWADFELTFTIAAMA